MESSRPITVVLAVQAGHLSKAIADLDDLVQAMLSSVPQSKPWQRQLRAYLSQVDREVQVFRMTMSLNRGEGELKSARDSLQCSLRAMNGYVTVGRADMGTKAAVRLALELGQKLEVSVAN